MTDMENTTQAPVKSEEAHAERTFTQAEVDKIVSDRLERDRRIRGVSGEQRFTQADVDRIVAERLSRERRVAAEARAGLEAPQKPSEQEADSTSEQSETERTAPLDAPQGAMREATGATADLMQRIHELEEINMRAKAREILATRGLPVSLENIIDFTSADTCHDSIDRIDAAVKQAVQDGINARISAPTARLPMAQRSPDYEHMSDSEYYAARYGENWNDKRR